jgi:hypothetical protein
MDVSPVDPGAFLLPGIFGVFQVSEVRVFENVFSGGSSSGNRDFVNLEVVDNVFSNCQSYCVGSSLNAQGMRVVDNEFTSFDVPSDGAIRASHLEGPDNMIENNTIQGLFANGIFVSNPHNSPDARVSILRNEIDIEGGNFGNGIYLDGLSNSSVRQNHISIADDLGTWGLLIEGSVYTYEVFIDGELVYTDEGSGPARGNVIANNSVFGGEVGMVVDGACSNSLLGNNLRSTFLATAFSLATTETDWFYEDGALIELVFTVGGTGDNAMAGKSAPTIEFPTGAGAIVGDGYLDCDGDGVSDPNIVSGTGVLQKAGLGRILGQKGG